MKTGKKTPIFLPILNICKKYAMARLEEEIEPDIVPHLLAVALVEGLCHLY